MEAVEKTTHLQIAAEYTDTPGPRFVREGEHSGEEFREKILEPRFLQAMESKSKLLVDLDGGYGYATSFLEEAFGGLARKYSVEQVLAVLEFKSDEEPYLIDSIRKYIRESQG